MGSNELKWLDACFMQKILQNIEDSQSIVVSSVIIKPALAKGENFLSDVYRVNVEFSRENNGPRGIPEEASFIVKIAPDGEFRKDLVSNGGIFKTEMSMMLEPLPKMNKILDKMNVTPLAARCVYAQNHVPIHLIVEDLMPKGFQMANRLEALDMRHCSISLRKLAAFHASSVALSEKDPMALRKYERGMFHNDHPLSLTTFFNASTKALGKEIAEWQELSPRICEKILKLSEVIFEKTSEIALRRENDFNVLNHGDFWVNNMMFRYNDRGEPVDVIFVDFQMSRYGSPAIDLLYFFATTCHDDFRGEKRELLLREYHATLTSLMAELKCETKVPSFEELQEILKNRAFYEVVAAITILPLVLIDKDESNTNLDDMIGEKEQNENQRYRNKLYRKVMSKLLPVYDSLGLLDS